MANKRTFKKAANELANSVSESILVVYLNSKGSDSEKVDQSVVKIFETADKAIRNSNRFFDKGLRDFGRDKKAYSRAKRAFFKDLFRNLEKELSDGLNDAMKEFNAALPAKA